MSEMTKQESARLRDVLAFEVGRRRITPSEATFILQVAGWKPPPTRGERVRAFFRKLFRIK